MACSTPTRRSLNIPTVNIITRPQRRDSRIAHAISRAAAVNASVRTERHVAYTVRNRRASSLSFMAAA